MKTNAARVSCRSSYPFLYAASDSLPAFRSGDSVSLARGTSNTLEKGLSGTYAVPSSAAIAEKVQQLSLRSAKHALF